MPSPTPLYVGSVRQAGPLPAMTMLYAKPSCTSGSWVMTLDHVAADGELIPAGLGHPAYVVRFAAAKAEAA